MAIRRECTVFGALAVSNDRPGQLMVLLLIGDEPSSGPAVSLQPVSAEQRTSLTQLVGRLVGIRGHAVVDTGQLVAVEPREVVELESEIAIREGLSFGDPSRFDAYFPLKPALDGAPPGAQLVNHSASTPGASFARVGDAIEITFVGGPGQTPDITMESTSPSSAALSGIGKRRQRLPDGTLVVTLHATVRRSGVVGITFTLTEGDLVMEEAVATLTTIQAQIENCL